jgi:hypothetical protein
MSLRGWWLVQPRPMVRAHIMVSRPMLHEAVRGMTIALVLCADTTEEQWRNHRALIEARSKEEAPPGSASFKAAVTKRMMRICVYASQSRGPCCAQCLMLYQLMQLLGYEMYDESRFNET